MFLLNTELASAEAEYVVGVGDAIRQRHKGEVDADAE